MKGMRFIAVVALVGIFALGVTTPGLAAGSSTFGVVLGQQPSQASGDLSKNTQGAEGSVKAAPFGQKLGSQPSQPSGDLSKNSAGPPGSVKPAPFGQKLGAQPSQPSGDLATNSAKH